MTLTRRRFLSVAAASALMPAAALAGPVRVISGGAFGSTWRAVVPEASREGAVRAIVERVVARIDTRMSPWRTDSEIAGVNRAGAGRHEVSPETAGIVAAALALSDETGGAFDPTVGPIVARHGLGPIHAGRAGSLDALRVHGARIETLAPDVTVDLCGIAKGHALKAMIHDLAGAGLHSGLVELGGEVAAIGQHPSGRAWQILAEGPQGRALVLAPGALAVATSGVTAQGYDLGTTRISHIVDPAGGAPVGAALPSVTVLDPDAGRADGLATALLAMGPARAAAFAEARGIPAILWPAGGAPVVTGGADEMILGEVAT